MPKIIVVDDAILSADTRAVHAANTVEAIALLEDVLRNGQEVDQLWIDYDLSYNKGIGEPTIRPVVDWLVTNQQGRTPLVVKQIYVHSRHSNAVIIVEQLNPYYHVQRAPLPSPLWWEQPSETD